MQSTTQMFCATRLEKAGGVRRQCSALAMPRSLWHPKEAKGASAKLVRRIGGGHILKAMVWRPSRGRSSFAPRSPSRRNGVVDDWPWPGGRG